MGLWRPKADFFLDELVCHDGLGDNNGPNLGCALCTHRYAPGDNTPNAVRLFKCRACGEFLQCKACCIAGHTRTPLHVLQVGGICSFVFSRLIVINVSGVERKLLGGHYASGARLRLPNRPWRDAVSFPRPTTAYNDSHRATRDTPGVISLLQVQDGRHHDECPAAFAEWLVSCDDHRSGHVCHIHNFGDVPPPKCRCKYECQRLHYCN